MGQFHQSLKDCSAAVHRRLDSCSILKGLLEDELTLSTYDEILVQYFVGYRAWQHQFDDAFERLQVGANWQIDLCLPALHQEINELSLSFRVHRCPPEMQLDSLADYLACAYVFKGASLGAKMILHKLQSNPLISDRRKLYFYRSQAASSRESWKKWLAQLEQEAIVRAISIEPIQLATLQCFETVYNWFNNLGVELTPSNNT